jgi:hypothetical protein
MCGDEAAAARSMLQITYPVCDHHPSLDTEGREALKGEPAGQRARGQAS